MLLLAIPMMGMSVGFAEDVNKDKKKLVPTSFTPSPEPVFSTPRAKPNIHMVLDDSASMGGRDVTLNGASVSRSEALEYAYQALVNKYKDKAYIGVSFLWQTYKLSEYERTYDRRKGQYIVTPEIASGLLRLPIKDYSELNVDDFSKTVINPISELIMNSPGNTPMYPGIYEAIKMFRGQPITANGVTSTRFEGQFPIVSLVDNYETIRVKEKYNAGTKWRPDWKERWVDQEQLVSQSYPSIKNKSPVRYRCQQNHMIVMTDGEPNDTRVWGIDTTDGLSASTNVSQSLQLKDGNVNLSAYADISTAFIDKNPGEKINHINILGRLTADMDLRKYQTGTDAAGKPWFDDEYSKPMPIYTHTVSLAVDPKSPIYTGLTSAINKANNKEQPGMNLGFAKGKGNAEDLLVAFDTIFSSIILSTSSTLSMNDRIHSDMLTKAPTVDKEGNVDLKSLGTIRYDTIYDFRQNFGSVRAMVPYISGYDASKATSKNPKGDAIVSSYELWSTDKSITPTQGRYVTLANANPGMNLVELAADENSAGYVQFHGIDPSFTTNHMDWLTNFKKTDKLNGMRGRLNPLGSITNSDITTVNKDILNINVNEKMMGKDFRLGLNQWLLYKAQHQPKNLLIVGDNDGFISFINAQRGLTGTHKGGQRDTAYFPQMLVPRFKEIAGLGLGPKQSLVMDGRTNLVDAKVYQEGGDHLYATLGLTAMGGGGKGLVGYRIYADSVKAVDDWVSSGRQKSGPKDDSIYHKVTPLFEITNESKNSDGKKAFEYLGYTYSGFEFFNRFVKGKGQAVAVFGNGFGTDKSVLYFIDAYTGKKLHEIVLNPNGMGAATPSIIVSADGQGGQKIDRVYVGDYSGTLYKVEFDTNDFTSSTAKVTALFKAPETNFGQSAIAVKPLVVKAKNSNAHRVFFGTGLAASHELDRGDHSLVTHAVYGVIDLPSKFKDGSMKLANDAQTILEPLFTVENLKKGYVNYKNKAQLDYEKLGQHDLELHAPSSQPDDSIENGTDNGWYMVLASDNDGIKDSKGAYGSDVGDVGSGERVIRDPQYDSEYGAVVFSTWAIRERDSELTIDIDKDPCISDLAYGKVLSLNITTGRAASKVSITNKGTTGTAQGVLTGDSIVSAPEGNNSSKLSDLDQITQYNIVNQKEKDKTTGEDTIKSEGVVDDNNSSYEMDNEKSGVYCLGGINGALECEEVARKPGGGGTDPVDPIDPIKPDPINPDPTNPVNPKVKGFQRLSIQTLLNS